MLAAVLIMAGVLVACHDNREPGPPLENDQLSLKTGKVYTAMEDDLQIRIKEIYDSRCPIGVVCFWAGEAQVNFEVTGKTKFDLTLILHRQPVDTVDQYIFRLVDVLPYPVYQKEVPDSEKTVILEVKRLE